MDVAESYFGEVFELGEPSELCEDREEKGATVDGRRAHAWRWMLSSLFPQLFPFVVAGTCFNHSRKK